jgi:predicted MFS family arabinose efflux permease
LGLILIPLAAGHAGLTTAFLMPAVLAALVLTGQGLRLQSTRSSGKKYQAMGSVFKTDGFKPFLVFVFLTFMSSYAISGWLPTYLRRDFGFDAMEAGLAASLSAIALSICSPLAGTLSDRLGARKPVLLAGSALSLVCFGIMAFSHDVRIIILAALLKGAGSAMTIPVSQMLAGEAFAAAGAGVAVGISSTAAQLASSASGPFFGFTLDATGSFSVLWSTALGCVVMSMLFITMVQERKWEEN